MQDLEYADRWYVKWKTQGVNSLTIEPGRGVKTRLKGYEKGKSRNSWNLIIEILKM